jgi:hypothetical protein
MKLIPASGRVELLPERELTWLLQSLLRAVAQKIGPRQNVLRP